MYTTLIFGSIIIALIIALIVFIAKQRTTSGTAPNFDASLLQGEFRMQREENQHAFKENRDELSSQLKVNREELTFSMKNLGETQSKTIADLANAQKAMFEQFSQQQYATRKITEERLQAVREELSAVIKQLGDGLVKRVSELSNAQQEKFLLFAGQQEQTRKITEEKLHEMRQTIEKQLHTMQEGNEKRLEEMRKVVDEKLQATIKDRFNESFKLISERLEQVHKGLGEMQTLASGVGDLKKVLTNVKTRGNLGEIQLGAILEEFMPPQQYLQNAVVKPNSLERVEYAIKLPSKSSESDYILLPIDSKFPNEDYQRLMDAYDNIANMLPKDMEAVVKSFENSVKKNAKDIHDKYISPPKTTDFAIMFVPTEGLYAEILRRTGLFETLRKDYKIVIVGPTNLVAFLNSLQMGFRTLAIEKRSSEVWELLAAVKTDFGRFGEILERTKKKLQEATNVIDDAGVRTRSIERKLRDIQALPQEKTALLLGETTSKYDLEEEKTHGTLPDAESFLR
jgi:DNA recombination protein RmuC